MTRVSRPVLRYHGGKWLLAPWIIDHFPRHRIYVEPYGGAGSVLLRKPRSYAEVWNDLDAEVVNLFAVLRGSDGPRLVEQLALTPYARDEFDLAYQVCDDPVERARRLVVRSLQGFGSDGYNIESPTGFRAAAYRSGTTPAYDWANYPEKLKAIIARLAGVTIENRPALAVIKQQDTPETLFYLDPPYVHSTRNKKHGSSCRHYTHEMSDGDHAEMLASVRDLEGLVVLSGYRHPLYEDALEDWRFLEKDTYADGARPRQEGLWISPRTWSALGRLI